MNNIRHNEKSFPSVSPFDMKIKYVETVRSSSVNQHDSHVHPECEIYINLSGDVSFMVGQKVYEISPYSIVITRPYEYHHCIYHSDEIHKHFWILLSSNGNEALLERFFDRPLGKDNLLVLPAAAQKELVSLCFEMTEGSSSPAEEYYKFFRLLHLINSAEATDSHPVSVYEDVRLAVEYIDLHFSERISVRELSSLCHVSLNTLERHFSQSIGASPKEYIKKKRMANAVIMLSEGSSVTDACLASGFSDYSGFIAAFRKSYGVTPKKMQNAKGKM